MQIHISSIITDYRKLDRTKSNLEFIEVVLKKEKMVRMMVMVLNGTFNNISVISWRSVLLVEETGVSEENQNSNSQHKW
jgi:hypothetical protein